MADDKAGWLLVGIQAVLLIAVITSPSNDLWPRPLWLMTIAAILIVVGIVVAAIAALGLGTALTASPVPRAGGDLQTDGVYRLVRHPIYSGVILALVGAALRSGSAVTAGLVIATIAFFSFKARWEERRLAARFPDYADYAARTGRFFPNPAHLLKAPVVTTSEQPRL